MYGGYGKAASYWSRDQLLSCLYKRAPSCIATTREKDSGKNRRIRRRTREYKEYDERKEERSRNSWRGALRRRRSTDIRIYDTRRLRRKYHLRFQVRSGRGVRQNNLLEIIPSILNRVMQREYLRVSEAGWIIEFNDDCVGLKLWYVYIIWVIFIVNSRTEETFRHFSILNHLYTNNPVFCIHTTY